MTRWFRYAYFVLAWLFVAGLVGQVFLISLYIFDRSDGGAAEAHVGLGWMLHLAPLLVLLFAYLSRAGRRHWLWAAALAAVVFVVPIFATLRSGSVVFAALHPVSAMLAFALAAVVAVCALRAVQGADRESDSVTDGTGQADARAPG